METTSELHQVRCPTCNARLFDTREKMEYVPYEDEADIVLRCWRRGQCGGMAMLYLRRVEELEESKVVTWVRNNEQRPISH